MSRGPTRLTDEQRRAVEAVAAARVTRDRADAVLTRAIVEAYEAFVPVTRIASANGTDRDAIYRRVRPAMNR